MELMCTLARGSVKASLNSKTSSSSTSRPGGSFFSTFFFPQARLCSVRRSSASSVGSQHPISNVVAKARPGGIHTDAGARLDLCERYLRAAVEKKEDDALVKADGQLLLSPAEAGRQNDRPKPVVPIEFVALVLALVKSSERGDLGLHLFRRAVSALRNCNRARDPERLTSGGRSASLVRAEKGQKLCWRTITLRFRALLSCSSFLW